MGFTDETDSITFRDLQERRELIRPRGSSNAAEPIAVAARWPGPLPPDPPRTPLIRAAGAEPPDQLIR